MANNLTVNPIVLDTVGATSAITRAIKISHIRWTGITTTDHTAVIHDAASGNVVWSANGVDGVDQHCDMHDMRFRGLYLTTLGSGVVYVYQS